MSGDEETLGNVKDHNDFEVLMWGYLPGVTARRSALTSPTSVPFPDAEGVAGDSWKDVYPGGCGFGMAISGYLTINIFLILPIFRRSSGNLIFIL